MPSFHCSTLTSPHPPLNRLDSVENQVYDSGAEAMAQHMQSTRYARDRGAPNPLRARPTPAVEDPKECGANL